MTLILLHSPVPATPADPDPRLSQAKFERTHMFAGRFLGEKEFDDEQEYADLRLASLLRGRPAGIVHGLEVNLGPQGVKGTGVNVSAGLALDGQGRVVSLHYPLRIEWQYLISSWQGANALSDASGIFYLLLQRASRDVDAGIADPCQRLDLDPSRDSRLEVTSFLRLQRLNLAPGALGTPQEQVENHVAADRVDGQFLRQFNAAVPLALLAIEPIPPADRVSGDSGFRPKWLSQEAGRYEAVRNGGYRVLLNQVSAAMRRVMQAAAGQVHNDAFQLPAFLEANLKLDFLPAAGQLPLDWLQNPAATRPNLLWLKSHVGVDMVPVPEEAIAELLGNHLARRVIDLRQPAGDKVRLLLAVNEPDYRPDLLDIPQTDAKLEEDLYRFHQRAHNAWVQWKMQFDKLYYIEPSNEPPLVDATLAPLEKAYLDPAQFRKVLGLPKPEPVPTRPEAVFEAIIRRADAELDPGDNDLPYPFSKGVPTMPLFYSRWLDNEAPPLPAPPDDDGYVVQYAVALVELEAIENQIRAQRSRVEKTRDLLLVMRQQLDSQTVALAALAGGVAGDGSGLQVARWLPYANIGNADLTSSASNTTPVSTAPVSVAPVADSSVRSRAASLMASAPARASMATSATAKGVSGNLLNNALVSSSSAAKANILLTSKAKSFSAFELGINKSRLEQLATITKTAVATPAFEAKEYRFGVIEHIAPEVNEYAKAYFGMRELLASLKDLFDATDASSLRAQLLKAGGIADAVPVAPDRKRDLLASLKNLVAASSSALQKEQLLKVGKILESGNATGTANSFERSGQLEAPEVLDAQAGEAAIKAGTAAEAAALAANPPATAAEAARIKADTIARLRPLYLSQYRYNALFKAGKILTQWIALCESRYNNLERKLQGKLREQSVQVAHIDKLAGLIREARETLEIRDRFRIEQLGDYGVAQRLLDEDWRQVFAVNEKRTRILTTALRGLYYVRVRPTPVSAPLLDPLELRHGSSGDIVPGCDWTEDVDLPAALEPFFQAVCEIPMDDWARLQPFRLRLPPVEQFGYLNQLRQARFKARPPLVATTATATNTLQARLQTVQMQTRGLLQQWSASALPLVSVASVQHLSAAAKVLSLEDLAGISGPLRKQAQDLRDQLEHCFFCLLENINQLPGSVRLQWGQLAEDDQIRVEDVAWWPGLDRAEADDFNATRTASELVAWLFRQLAADASAASRAAVRNMMRALLIHASLGDPQEIVRGTVHVPPRFAGLGERLQVKLNRAPAVGTRLQLLNAEQQLVAMLAVEDHGPQGTEVSIVQLVQPDVRISTRFSVVANKRTAQLA